MAVWVDESRAIELAEAWRAGDAAALGELYAYLLPVIRVVAARAVRVAPRWIEAADLVQDAYEVLGAAAMDWTPGEYDLVGFLVRRLSWRLRNCCLLAGHEVGYRAAWHGEDLADAEIAERAGLVDDDIAEAVCDRVTLWPLMKRLPVDQARLLCVVAAGYAVEEACGRLGLSRWQAHERFRLARAAMMRELAAAGLGPPDRVRWPRRWMADEGARAALLAAFLRTFYVPGEALPGESAARAAGMSVHGYAECRRLVVAAGLVIGGGRGGGRYSGAGVWVA